MMLVLSFEEKENILKLSKETGMGVVKCAQYLKKYINFVDTRKALLSELKLFSQPGKESRIFCSLNETCNILSTIILSSHTPFVCDNEIFINSGIKFSKQLLIKKELEINNELQILSNQFGETINLEYFNRIENTFKIFYYLHHDRKKLVILEYSGDINNIQDIALTALLLNIEDEKQILLEYNINNVNELISDIVGNSIIKNIKIIKV
jgi:hypothetical protein